MGKVNKGFLESVKAKKSSPLLVGAMITLSSGMVLAADLTVTDKDGVAYLKVDSSEGSNVDLKVTTNSKSNNSESLTLTRTGESTGTKKVLGLSEKEVLFGNVKVGTYTLTASSDLVKVEEVSVVPENIAKSEEGSKDLQKAGYAVGGVALIGGIVGASAGSDAFGGSSSGSNGNPAREGTLGSDSESATDDRSVSGASTDPRVAPSFDPNQPNTGVPVAAPSASVISTPTPRPAETPFQGQNGNPTPTPAPTVTDPMTPS